MVMPRSDRRRDAVSCECRSRELHDATAVDPSCSEQGSRCEIAMHDAERVRLANRPRSLQNEIDGAGTAQRTRPRATKRSQIMHSRYFPSPCRRALSSVRRPRQRATVLLLILTAARASRRKPSPLRGCESRPPSRNFNASAHRAAGRRSLRPRPCRPDRARARSGNFPARIWPS